MKTSLNSPGGACRMKSEAMRIYEKVPLMWYTTLKIDGRYIKSSCTTANSKLVTQDVLLPFLGQILAHLSPFLLCCQREGFTNN